MTVNAFLEFFNFENSIQSSEKINYGEIVNCGCGEKTIDSI